MRFRGKVFIVYDGQAGSSGKGKFVGLFSFLKNINVAINNNSPSSGHTFVFDNNEKIITTHLPIAFVSPQVKYLVIGAGAIVNPETLENEIEIYKDILRDRKVYIHKRATIVLPKHIQEELKTIRSGSTFKGSGAALAEKILRKPNMVLAKDFNWNKKIELIDDDFIQNLMNGENGFTGEENILIETSQGFDLDINHGLDYPYVTSRQCSPAQALADCGIPHNVKTETYMVIRPYPIRISNDSKIGKVYAGDYGNSKEIYWEVIEQRSGCKNLKEKEQTTITKRLRRVFEFSEERFKRAVAITNPDYIILNFAQYISVNDKTQIDNWINNIENKFDVKVAYVGMGEKRSEYEERI